MLERQSETAVTQAVEAAAAREAANSWLSQFAPLLQTSERATATECRQAIARLEALRPQGLVAAERLRPHAEGEGSADRLLLDTLHSALEELDGLESTLRRRLAVLSPGDPDGEVDLETVRAQLARAAARREVERLTSPVREEGPSFEAVTSYADWKAAFFPFIFSLGWNAFTTFHAFFMIWGMSRAFGLGALALLLFYSIFWAVGFGMLALAARQASAQRIVLTGRRLVVHTRLGPWERVREYTLAPHSRAVCAQGASSTGNTPSTDILLRAENGAQVRLGAGLVPEEQARLVADLNRYLEAYERQTPSGE